MLRAKPAPPAVLAAHAAILGDDAAAAALPDDVAVPDDAEAAAVPDDMAVPDDAAAAAVPDDVAVPDDAAAAAADTSTSTDDAAAPGNSTSLFSPKTRRTLGLPDEESREYVDEVMPTPDEDVASSADAVCTTGVATADLSTSTDKAAATAAAAATSTDLATPTDKTATAVATSTDLATPTDKAAAAATAAASALDDWRKTSGWFVGKTCKYDGSFEVDERDGRVFRVEVPYYESATRETGTVWVTPEQLEAWPSAERLYRNWLIDWTLEGNMPRGTTAARIELAEARYKADMEARKNVEEDSEPEHEYS
jgi:hypothetical protein